jgi:ABC-type branched-subunit amino acid transport system substrate-binding protein
MAGMLQNSQTHSSIVVGPLFTDETTYAAISGAALRIPQLSPACTAQDLESRDVFSYFNRLVPADYSQMEALTDILLHFRKLTGQKQWLEVGIYAQADSLGVGLTGSFFTVAALKDVTILGFQQALTVLQNNNVYPDYTRDLLELKKTGARVFISFWTTSDFNHIVPVIMEEGMFGNQYVWMCYEGCSDGGIAVDLTDPEFTPYPDRNRATAGFLGLAVPQGVTPEFLALRKSFAEFNPNSPNLDRYSALVYDSVFAAGRALDLVIRNGLELTPQNINSLLKNVSFDGMTGHIAFNPNGNRKTFYHVLNSKVFEDVDCFECVGISPNNAFVRVGTWDDEKGLDLSNGDFPITFYDRTENPPDLDVREPFDYWSCKDGKKKRDDTGHVNPLITYFQVKPS